ncbi:MAG: hypothetical protein OJF49_003530 [Ktedonobacterales bacterium]|nr:MAG: hypothetical protein OJF49_003530 [Ktedonobacterales bacterium]
MVRSPVRAAASGITLQRRARVQEQVRRRAGDEMAAPTGAPAMMAITDKWRDTSSDTMRPRALTARPNLSYLGAFSHIIAREAGEVKRGYNVYLGSTCSECIAASSPSLFC